MIDSFNLNRIFSILSPFLIIGYLQMGIIQNGRLFFENPYWSYISSIVIILFVLNHLNSHRELASFRSLIVFFISIIISCSIILQIPEFEERYVEVIFYTFFFGYLLVVIFSFILNTLTNTPRWRKYK